MALVTPSKACWLDPYLRSFETRLLTSFDVNQTKEQLKRLEKAQLVRSGLNASSIYHDSDGHPLLNFLLAKREREKAFDELLDYYFSRVPPKDQDRLRNYLKAVCTLGVLEDAFIERALKIYQQHKPGAAGFPVQPVGVRTLLRRYWLAQTRPTSPGQLVLVGGVKRAVQGVLRAQETALYNALGQLAI